MRIAILTSGILPVPAVQGGAVENLVDFYLDYNDRHQLHDITVYSAWHPNVEKHPALKSEVNHYIYIKTEGWTAAVCKHLMHWLNKKNEYYHHTIEYYFRQALKRLQGHSYDCIIIENRPGYALLLKKRINAKIVLHLHNEKLDSDTRLGREIYTAISLIITVSDYISSRVQSIMQDKGKCVTIHNGIDIKAFSPKRNKEKTPLFTDSDFVVVFSGRLTPEKGILELIEAIYLLKDFPEIKLLIIGSSFYGNAEGDDDFTMTLKQKSELVKNRIVFTGFIPYSQMPDYLSMADVAVIPSVWDDPFPTTVLEAQAMGLPIITTSRGGIPEEVTEENAILLKTDEHFVENLSLAILNLYKHPELQKLMAEVSALRTKKFDKDDYAKRFFRALEQL